MHNFYGKRAAPEGIRLGINGEKPQAPKAKQANTGASIKSPVNEFVGKYGGTDGAYKWLIGKDGWMHCAWCLALLAKHASVKADAAFVQGSTNTRTSALSDHDAFHNRITTKPPIVDGKRTT